MPPPREQRLNDIHQLWTTFAERFGAGGGKTRDAALAYPGYASAFLKKVWADAVGFCGSERSAAASDCRTSRISTLSDDAMRRVPAPRHYSGQSAIVLAERIDSVDELLARVRQYAECACLTQPSPQEPQKCHFLPAAALAGPTSRITV